MKHPFRPSRLSPIAKIYAIAIPLSLIFMFGIGYVVSTDTRSYFNAWQSLQKGCLDQFRTPVYPVIVGCFESIFGEVEFVKSRELVFSHGNVLSYYEQITGSVSSLVAYLVVGLQFIVFLISLLYFYKIARLLTHSERCSVGCTLLYTIVILISGVNNQILTESLSLSATIFFLYSFVQSVKTDSNLYTIAALFWSLFLVFLRPSFLFIPCCALFLGLCLIFIKKYRKPAIKNIVAGLVVMFTTLVYCYQFEKTYDSFSPTLVSVTNQYMIARTGNMIDSCKIEDEALRADIQSLPSSGIGGAHLVQKHGAKTINSLVTKANESNRRQYFINILERLYSACESNCLVRCTYKMGIFNSIQLGLGINLRLELYILLLYVVLIFHWRKSRTDEELIYLLLILLLSFSNWIVAIMGAQAEYSRLLTANIPLIFLLIADFSVRFRRRMRKNPAKESD